MRIALDYVGEKHVILVIDDSNVIIKTGLMDFKEANDMAIDMIVVAQELLYCVHQDEAANECDNVIGSISDES